MSLRQRESEEEAKVEFPIPVKGAPGSPYTRKMLAVLRYRHIPYRLLIDGHPELATLPQPKVSLLPTFYFRQDNGEYEAVVDSTPIIRHLETIVPGRSVLPTDPALRFVDYLIEDYGDEWLTKAMFHYRWYYADDIRKAGEILPRWRNLTATDEQIEPLAEAIRERQINRLYVVGSNDTTAPLIERSYRRFLALFRSHLSHVPFVLGHRPGAADFGIFGQLTQLAHFDPTPAALTLESAPSVYAWVDVVNDLSGLDPKDEDWLARESIPDSLRELLREIGRTYVPLLLANERAVNARAGTVTLTLDGARWEQQPYPYQAKCLQWLRQEYAKLDENDRGWVDRMLQDTGCEALFTAPP